MLPALLLALLVNTSSYRVQYPLPGPTIPDGMGVDIHFVIPPGGEIEKIAAQDFKWIRMDMYWMMVEKHPPAYNFKPYDMLMDELDKNHIRPIFILDTINTTYGTIPSDPNVQAGFCRFVRAAVEHFKHRGVVWELWNEPNLDDYWKPHASFDEYMTLARQVGETIRSVSPDEWFIAPALSHTDWPYLEGCFRGGLLDLVDGVSIHPYRNETPETVTADWEKLKSLIRQYAPEGKQIAMISGEWGYSSLSTGDDLQGAYAARMVLVNLLKGVDLSIWYDWTDDTDSPEERERHFGAMYSSDRAKPVANELKELGGLMDGYTFVKRLPSDPDQYLLLFQNANSQKLIAWTQSGNAAQLDIENGMHFEQSLMAGKPSAIAPNHLVQIDGTPTIISE